MQLRSSPLIPSRINHPHFLSLRQAKPSWFSFSFLFSYFILLRMYGPFGCWERKRKRKLWTSNLESIHLFVCRFFSIQNFLLLWFLLWPRVLTCTAQTLFCYCCIKIIQCSFNLLEIMIFFILFWYRDFDTIFVFISSKQLSVQSNAKLILRLGLLQPGSGSGSGSGSAWFSFSTMTEPSKVIHVRNVGPEISEVYSPSIFF